MAKRKPPSFRSPRPQSPPSAPVPAPSRPVPVWMESALRYGLWITLAAAVVTHGVHWLCVRAHDPLYAQTMRGFDMYTYWSWAQKIVGGDWLSREYTNGTPFYYGPLYPYALAVVFRILGESYHAVHGLQAVLGVAPPVLLYAVSRRLLTPGAALATGLLTAFCAPFLFYEQLLLMEGFLIVLHAAIVWALVRGQEGRRWAWAWALAAGACSGVACWGRGNFLLAIPLLAVTWAAVPQLLEWVPPSTAAAWGGPGRPEGSPALLKRWRTLAGCLCAAAYLAGAGMFLAIPLARNLYVAHRVVVTTTNGPINLYIGNASDALGIFSYPESFDRLVKQYESQDAVPWSRELRRDILANPRSFLTVLLRKTWMFWNSYDVADNASYYLNKRHSFLLRWSPVAWGTVVPLGLFGLWMARRDWRRHVFLLVYAVGFCVSIVAVFISGRFRVEELLPFLVWGGGGVAVWARGAWDRRANTAALQALAVAIGVFILWPLWSPAAAFNTPATLPSSYRQQVHLVRANDYSTMAMAHLKWKQMAEARAILEEGIAAYPWYEALVTRLAALHAQEGRPETTVSILENYLRVFGGSPALRLQLADALARCGRTADARTLLEALLRADPQNAQARALLNTLAGMK